MVSRPGNDSFQKQYSKSILPVYSWTKPTSRMPTTVYRRTFWNFRTLQNSMISWVVLLGLRFPRNLTAIPATWPSNRSPSHPTLKSAIAHNARSLASKICNKPAITPKDSVAELIPPGTPFPVVFKIPPMHE